MYSFGDVIRLPEYGRDERAWAGHQREVIRRSCFGPCDAGVLGSLRRWLDKKTTR